MGLDLQSLLVSHCWALRHVVSMHFGWLHWQLVSFWDSWEIFASAPKALVLSTNSFSLTDCQQAFPCGIVTSDGIVYLMPCRTAILIFSKHLSRDASTSNTEISSASRFLNKNSGPEVLWALVFQCKGPLRICRGGAHLAVPSLQTNH